MRPPPRQVPDQDGEHDEDRDPAADLGDDPDERERRGVPEAPVADHRRDPQVEPFEGSAGQQVGRDECTDDQGEHEQPPRRAADRDRTRRLGDACVP
jgi:hypothetical protein